MIDFLNDDNLLKYLRFNRTLSIFLRNALIW